ncbi:MAG: RHS repeat-associated core domain protein [Microgenomates group bacterium GW2011_GWC1_37_8]|uniref:YD repeat protein n=1 Tax=Candidatus Woesebacteria bacterium GW2011_GWB1_38_8 TaxID=1618570 RepID=A0A0G0LBY8_9BACT|nr:MAG: RHS repeat-associated core domain protein [Microgenomates group bacterium GW2011_GWC1_37_8]KKQ85375.1 MAG: hypothetical protein UT08_C0007G0048 [Candidatus Woesebacteria bacterium GW2011_GWB1_38_8]
MKLKTCPKIVVSCWIICFVFTSEAKAAEKLNFIHHDHLGSTVLMTSDKGEVISKQSYYPYGATRSQSLVVGSKQIERQYTGQVSDQDQTGLYYYNARYYNPTIAKFTQADSLFEGLNKYSYVRNNPIVNTDPSGRQTTQLTDGSEGCDNVNMIDCLLILYTQALKESGSLYQGKAEIMTQLPLLSESFGELNDTVTENLSLGLLSLSEMGGFDIGFLGYACQFCYSAKSDTIFAFDPPIGILMANILDLSNKLYAPSSDIDYSLAISHEVRHYWQDYYDPQHIFTNMITKQAIAEGLTGGADNFRYILPIWKKFHNLDIRPHGAFGLFLTWDNDLEIDAIIAETMLSESSSASFREEHPQIWNSMVSQWGFFNPDKYKWNLDNFLGKIQRGKVL